MKESLLSHIADKFIAQYENVANSNMTYLLNTYPAARHALASLLDMPAVPDHYENELASKGHGRPDITGKNSDGNTTVIIEGKFWASLTDNQPQNYLKELSPDGKLLFLAPNQRQTSLDIQLNKLSDQQEKRIIVSSWTTLIDLIENENKKDPDKQLTSDVAQLRELCEKVEKEELPPLSKADLDPAHGRLCYQFADLLDECKDALGTWDEINFEGLRSTNTKYGYGFYFRTHNYACFLCLSTFDWYDKKSHTPVWLYIFDKDFNKSYEIYRALNDFDLENSYDEDEYAAYGIVLTAGMDKKEIIDHIVETVKKVLTAINEKQ